MKPYYEQDGITIYHADCRDVLPTLADGSIDLVLTDPPYGIALANHGLSKRSWKVRGDDSRDIAQWVIEWSDQRRLPVIAFSSPQHPYKGEWKQYLCWDKGDSVGIGGERSEYWKFSWELIQVARTGKLTGKREPSVLEYPVSSASYRFHPCQKPVSLIVYLMRKTTNDDAVVLDPFMGSGTTLVAARESGRRAIGIEIEEKYCEIAVKRLAQAVLPLEVTA